MDAQATTLMMIELHTMLNQPPGLDQTITTHTTGITTGHLPTTITLMNGTLDTQATGGHKTNTKMCQHSMTDSQCLPRNITLQTEPSQAIPILSQTQWSQESTLLHHRCMLHNQSKLGSHHQFKLGCHHHQCTVTQLQLGVQMQSQTTCLIHGHINQQIGSHGMSNMELATTAKFTWRKMQMVPPLCPFKPKRRSTTCQLLSSLLPLLSFSSSQESAWASGTRILPRTPNKMDTSKWETTKAHHKRPDQWWEITNLMTMNNDQVKFCKLIRVI